MTLFLNTIANDVAGTVVFSLPNCDNDRDTTGKGNYRYTIVQGFLSEDPVINMKNNWESVIPDATALSDFTQLAGIGATSWISTSKASWKGTDPITVTLNFYLLTYRLAQLKGGSKNPQDMPVSEQAARFAQLLAVSPKANANNNGKLSDFGINVHGGYRANYFEPNADFSGNKQNSASEDAYGKIFANSGSLDVDLDDADGTIQIVINGGGHTSAVFTKMLLADASFTSSPVRCGYWSTDNGVRTFHTSKEPLYIKVAATFRLMHTATVRDAVRMFTGETNL